MTNEKSIGAINGYLMFFFFLALIFFDILGFIYVYAIIPILLSIFTFYVMVGFFVITPNNSKVMLLFGNYKGTVKKNGFFWRSPFYSKRTVSLKARNFESERLKVNDKMGNPIIISAILVWKVDNTYKAMYDVDDFVHFVRIQTDSAVRKLAGMYPYDHFEDESAVVTLSSSFDLVNKSLEEEISDRLKIAGLSVVEARIGYLAYAPEIAQAMLKRQQAEAIIAARTKIVEGAVGMVDSALKMLDQREIVKFDENKKSNLVSNLLVVLCSDSDVEPILNAGE